MESQNNMQDAYISELLRELHGALVDIVSVMNQPHRDEALLNKADVKLDRTLFPLLVGINKFGPIGVVDIAERAGRDYTTVSRQLGKLEELGLIERKSSASDRRVHQAVIAPLGKELTDKIDQARDSLGRAVFASWEIEDIVTLVRLMRKFADEIDD